jgi:hypothetical protein
MTNLLRRPRALPAGLGAVALAGVLALAAASTPAGAAAPTRTVAEATLHANTKVVVTASRSAPTRAHQRRPPGWLSTSAAPAATGACSTGA